MLTIGRYCILRVKTVVEIIVLYAILYVCVERLLNCEKCKRCINTKYGTLRDCFNFSRANNNSVKLLSLLNKY